MLLRRTLLCLAALLAALPSLAAANDIVATLTAESVSVDAAKPLRVTLTLLNKGEKPAKMLTWLTTGDGVNSRLFQVSRDGRTLPFLGAHYKRAAPTEQDYVSLAPGASVSQVVDLSRLYDFSVSGHYAIKYDVTSLNLYQRSTERAAVNAPLPTLASLASNSVRVEVNGRPATWQENLGLDPQEAASLSASTIESASLSFSQCSATQKATVNNALAAARRQVTDSLDALQADQRGKAYISWFGAYSPSRDTAIKSHFSRLNEALNSKPLAIDCGCQARHYAYVYAHEPYQLYLCQAFWSAPITGNDSRAGTLLHTLSHFKVVAASDDYAYGAAGARALARSNPARAIENADNLEYFAENLSLLP